MFQKSVVVVSRYPYVNLFERLVKVSKFCRGWRVRDAVVPALLCAAGCGRIAASAALGTAVASLRILRACTHESSRGDLAGAGGIG